MPTGTLIGFNHGDSDSGTTSSAISNGTLNIRDPAKQQQDVATLSHDVEHANGIPQGLTPISQVGTNFSAKSEFTHL
ncbi:Hemolysin [Pseudomonas orientalis]|uniref:hypothetical protein n=1 Tax=Pseudomonas orientalis TaxID=76758 RepID=UPI000F566A55|nr:hypothetical protein [Pseudomonas orientalis]AZE81607.1 Hemolysin [Pseudomonas orientalis]